MIKLFLKILFASLKIGLVAFVVLLISQIPVGSKRICDHVGKTLQSSMVRKPVLWIGKKFDFVEGHGQRRSKLAAAAAAAKKNANTGHGETDGQDAAGTESEVSEQAELSGLLKD